MIQIAPLTHRPLLHRETCPICQRDTLHRRWTCLTCGTVTQIVVIRRKAFGARLVLNRKPRSS